MEVIEHRRIRHAVSMRYRSSSAHKHGIAYLKIIDDAFAVQEIVRDSKEIPVKSLAPGILGVQALWVT